MFYFAELDCEFDVFDLINEVGHLNAIDLAIIVVLDGFYHLSAGVPVFGAQQQTVMRIETEAAWAAIPRGLQEEGLMFPASAAGVLTN